MSLPGSRSIASGMLLLSLFAASNVVAAETLAIPTPTTKPSTVSRIIVPALPTTTAKKPLRVLFIGNSYTFFNGGMGTLVQSLASAVKGGRRLEFVEVTKGGQTFEGHW